MKRDPSMIWPPPSYEDENTARKPVPTRITIWLPDDDMRLDMRVWLDDLRVQHEPVEAAVFGDMNRTYEPSGHSYFTVHAHTSPQEQGWKFHRGKPVVR